MGVIVQSLRISAQGPVDLGDGTANRSLHGADPLPSLKRRDPLTFFNDPAFCLISMKRLLSANCYTSSVRLTLMLLSDSSLAHI